MHKLQSSAEKELHQQIHHQMHHANVDEHISHKAPGLFPPIRIIDEQGGGGSISAESDVFHPFVLVVSARISFCTDTSLFETRLTEYEECR